MSDHIALNATSMVSRCTRRGHRLVSRSPQGPVDLLEVTEKVKSLFPLDYFSNMVRSIPAGSVVTINLGSDFPVKLEFEIADKRGNVNYLLAPRIESD